MGTQNPHRLRRICSQRARNHLEMIGLNWTHLASFNSNTSPYWPYKHRTVVFHPSLHLFLRSFGVYVSSLREKGHDIYKSTLAWHEIVAFPIVSVCLFEVNLHMAVYNLPRRNVKTSWKDSPISWMLHLPIIQPPSGGVGCWVIGPGRFTAARPCEKFPSCEAVAGHGLAERFLGSLWCRTSSFGLNTNHGFMALFWPTNPRNHQKTEDIC